MRKRVYVPDEIGLTDEETIFLWQVLSRVADTVGTTSKDVAEKTFRLWGHMVAFGRACERAGKGDNQQNDSTCMGCGRNGR